VGKPSDESTTYHVETPCTKGLPMNCSPDFPVSLIIRTRAREADPSRINGRPISSICRPFGRYLLPSATQSACLVACRFSPPLSTDGRPGHKSLVKSHTVTAYLTNCIVRGAHSIQCATPRTSVQGQGGGSIKQVLNSKSHSRTLSHSLLAKRGVMIIVPPVYQSAKYKLVVCGRQTWQFQCSCIRLAWLGAKPGHEHHPLA
jgi:hypothetical protein